MVIDDTGSVEDIHAFIYCKKWRSGQVSRMPHSLTDSQRKDRATQLLIKYKSEALVTQKEKSQFSSGSLAWMIHVFEHIRLQHFPQLALTFAVVAGKLT